MDFSSMRPSSWNGVGAIAKVPAALWVSFVIGAFSYFSSSFRDGPPGPDLRCAIAHRGISRFRVRSSRCAPERRRVSKSPRAHLDFFLGEENLLGMFNHVPRLPSRMRRFPARLLHHPHFPHATRAGNAEHLAGLVPGEIADHV